MIRLFKETNNKLEIIENVENIYDKIEENMWVHLVNPSINDITKIAEKTKINQQMLLSLMDEEETAHLDKDDDDTLIVVDIPYLDDGFYTTIPFSIVYNSKFFVTICMKDANLVSSMIQKFKKIEPHKHVRLSLLILYRISSIFITSLKKVDEQTKDVERILHSSMRNKELFDLMELNKTLVYFSTALNSNKIVLNKLTRLQEYKKYEDDYDLMEDVEIENNQAIEMCSIYRDILAGMMDAFASIISNNLNIVMKALAVVTIVLSIPTVIASFFGMNFDKIPLESNENGFVIIFVLSLITSIIGAVILYMYTKKVKNK